MPGRSASPTVVAVVSAAFFAWAAVVWVGLRLPYIHTEQAFQLRAYLLFPFFVLWFAYWGFVRRTPENKTGYELALEGKPSRKDKITFTVWSLIGLFGISAGLAWTSIAFPACGAQLTSGQPFARTYEVVSVAATGGAVWSTVFDVTLQDVASGEQVLVSLTRNRYERHPVKKSERICVEGHTSFFGATVESVAGQSCANAS